MRRAGWLVAIVGCGRDPQPAPAPAVVARPIDAAAPAVDAAPVVPDCVTPGLYRVAFADGTVWRPYQAAARCTPPPPVWLRLSVPRTDWVELAEVAEAPPHASLGTQVITAMTSECQGQLTLRRDALDLAALVTFERGALRFRVTRAFIGYEADGTRFDCSAPAAALTATRVGD